LAHYSVHVLAGAAESRPTSRTCSTSTLTGLAAFPAGCGSASAWPAAANPTPLVRARQSASLSFPCHPHPSSACGRRRAGPWRANAVQQSSTAGSWLRAYAGRRSGRPPVPRTLDALPLPGEFLHRPQLSPKWPNPILLCSYKPWDLDIGD